MDTETQYHRGFKLYQAERVRPDEPSSIEEDKEFFRGSRGEVLSFTAKIQGLTKLSKL